MDDVILAEIRDRRMPLRWPSFNRPTRPDMGGVLLAELGKRERHEGNGKRDSIPPFLWVI